MKWQITICLLLAVAGSTAPCFAADPRYPDWPCAQASQVRLPRYGRVHHSRGRDKWRRRQGGGLVPLAARRTHGRSSKTITEFLLVVGAKARPASCFRRAVRPLNAAFRSWAGRAVTRNSAKPRTGSYRHAGAANLQDASPPDQGRELGNQLVWETRIFEDRRRVIKFVCEVPTAIDQRLFALGRIIQQQME